MTSLMTLPNYMTGFLYELGPSSGVYRYDKSILEIHLAKLCSFKAHALSYMVGYPSGESTMSRWDGNPT